VILRGSGLHSPICPVRAARALRRTRPTTRRISWPIAARSPSPRSGPEHHQHHGVDIFDWTVRVRARPCRPRRARGPAPRQAQTVHWTVCVRARPCRPRRARGPAPRQAQTVHWTVCVRARLLKRVFDLDLEHCPNCGGELKIIAPILEQPVIEKILTHLGLQARAPPRAPARGQALQAA